MRILIVGGFGFIGGRLAEYLAQNGHQIVLGSRNSISPPDWLYKAEVTRIAWDDEVELERSCDGVDIVINAAGMSAHDCASDPVAALTVNGVGTARLVSAANRSGAKRFIYLSTAHVYSSPLVGDITEETCPRNIHPYATSHVAGESAVLSASSRGEIEGVVLRISNAFGAPIHRNVNCWMLLVNDLCRQAVETRKLVLQTSGLMQRDFIAMTKVCHAIEHFTFDYMQSNKASVFNLGAGESQSVLAMAEIVQQRCAIVLGFWPELQHKKSKVNECYPNLTYRVDRLSAMGISNENLSDVTEIDRLLYFCQLEFTQKMGSNR
jgi:UDP-glucose 4-epimerase